MTDTLRELDLRELHALALLDDGADMAKAMADSELAREQIVEANNLRAAHRRLNGGVTVVASVDLADPAPVVDLVPPQRDDAPAEAQSASAPGAVSIATLLARADAIGGRHALFLAERILRDVDDLTKTLAEDEASFAAREHVAQLKARKAELDAELAAAEASLRELAGTPAPRKVVAKKVAAKPVKKVAAKKKAESGGPEYSARVRTWAIEQGMTVSKFGRMKDEIVTAYQDAHPTGAQS
jgi:Lsr2